MSGMLCMNISTRTMLIIVVLLRCLDYLFQDGTDGLALHGLKNIRCNSTIGVGCWNMIIRGRHRCQEFIQTFSL